MSGLIFSCATNNPKFLVQVISAVAWRDQEDQYCAANISKDGILLLPEECFAIQASAFLRASTFTNYAFIRDENYEFRINLTKFLKCLKLFSDTATEVEIRSRIETKIEIKIMDALSTTECIVNTLIYSPAQMNQIPLSKVFSAPDTEDVAIFMLKSSIARQMFMIPEATANRSSSPVIITIDYQAKVFEVREEGAFGAVKSTMDFSLLMSQRSTFNLQEPFRAAYPVASFSRVLNAMALSTVAGFRFKENGLVSIQLDIDSNSGGSVKTVVEFILQPLQDAFDL